MAKKEQKLGQSGAKYLTDDLVMEILPHLPAKSLLRFRCISKPWLAFISDVRNHKKLPLVMSGLFHDGARSPEYISTQKGRGDCDSIDTRRTFLPKYEKLRILDCCNGYYATPSAILSPRCGLHSLTLPITIFSGYPYILILIFPTTTIFLNLSSWGLHLIAFVSKSFHQMGRWIWDMIQVNIGITIWQFNLSATCFQSIRYLLYQPLIVGINKEGIVCRKIKLPNGEDSANDNKFLGHSGVCIRIRGKTLYLGLEELWQWSLGLEV